MKVNIAEAFDSKAKFEPVEHGFMKITCEREFFVDMKNGELYSQMPEFIQYGDFEITYIGGWLYTRTKRIYGVRSHPALALRGKYGLYLTLPYDDEPEDEIMKRMAVTPKRYEVCLLNGDESGVYWLLRVLEDDSLVVMDDDGVYFHVRRNVKTGRAMKRRLGCVGDEDEKAMMLNTINEMDERIVNRLKREAAKAKREAERERERQIAIFISAEPFQAGMKWGLKQKNRIVVPPIYRTVMPPVGKYCVVEMNPRQWGVILVNGQIVIEPKYEAVKLNDDGTAEITVYRGNTKKINLGK